MRDDRPLARPRQGSLASSLAPPGAPSPRSRGEGKRDTGAPAPEKQKRGGGALADKRRSALSKMRRKNAEERRGRQDDESTGAAQARRRSTSSRSSTTIPVPQATEGHVVIRVRASSFNYHDVFTVKGMPGIKVPLPVVIGLDMAGEIAEVGAGRREVEGRRPRAGQSGQQEEGPDGRDARRRHGGILPGRRRPARRDAGRRELRGRGLAAGRLRHRAPHADHPQHREEGRPRASCSARQRRRRHRLRACWRSCSAPR